MYLLCAGLVSHAQEWTKKINDSDFHNRRSKGLKIGDKMPDISLGSVWNNKTGKTRFSDFKGKLIILDFWSQGCSDCIAAFPKMEKLQKEFKDEIQIFLFNPWEMVDDVIMHFKKNSEDLKMPDLPCIQKDTKGISEQLLKLLPVMGVTTQVWIDKDGKITLIGSSRNNTSKKIRDFLDGKEVYKLNNNSLNPNFDPSYPYVKLLGDFKTTPVKYSSTFTGFNNEYQAQNPNRALNILDSAAGTIRNTFVNTFVLDLYSHPFKDIFLAQQKKILYEAISHRGYVIPFNFELPKDTLRYTYFHKYLNGGSDDSIYRKPKFCYEQILPINVPVELQKKYMLEDLNRYFSSLYGTYGRLEKRVVPCYELVQLAGSMPVNSKSRNPDNLYSTMKKVNTVKDWKKYVRYENYSLSLICQEIFENQYLRNEFLENKKSSKPAILFNETGLEGTAILDLLELPEAAAIKSMEDYRRALNKIGFDIKVSSRSLNFLVITDNSGK